MDDAQRHAAEKDIARANFDENEDRVLKISNFLLMERFFVMEGKDPWCFSKRLCKLFSLPIPKIWRVMIVLKKDVELRQQNSEWQEH